MIGLDPAPVALFAFRRPLHLEKVVESLRANPEAPHTDLVVFSDAPRNRSQQDEVEKVRSYARGIEGFRSVRVVERDVNFGLAKSIIAGVAEILEDRESVIVLEDDLVVAPTFLAYMNEGLERYREDPRVASIHGYRLPMDDAPERSYFLRGADCWGWATWRRAWAVFEVDGSKLLELLEASGEALRFDFDGAYAYIGMLKDQIAGRNDSWAVRWYASAFLERKLTLHPARSLVSNIGIDGSGTHSGTTRRFDASVSASPVRDWPREVTEDQELRDAMIRFYRTPERRNFRDRALSALSRLDKRLRNGLVSVWGA
jgi:hypothetical protein